MIFQVEYIWVRDTFLESVIPCSDTAAEQAMDMDVYTVHHRMYPDQLRDIVQELTTVHLQVRHFGICTLTCVYACYSSLVIIDL